MRLYKLLEKMAQEGASDLLIKAGSPPYIRVNKKLRRMEDEEPISGQEAEEMAREILDEEKINYIYKGEEADVAFDMENIGRFRANVFKQCGKISFAIRKINDKVPSFEELKLPADVLKRLCAEERGLILVTGPAGSGKSTTLAAMVDYINHNMQRHIVTIEDPIEYIFREDKSLIQQREVGLDTRSFRDALKHVVRQSPDVIMVGELRDTDSVSVALMAAETGHLVLSTLHTINARQTVERLISFFPPYLHDQVRMRLSLTLKGVLSLRLLRRQDGMGLVPAVEIMLVSPRIQELIAEGRIAEISEAIEASEQMGMQTFNQALLKLYKEGLISYEEGVKASDSKHEFSMRTRGVFAAEIEVGSLVMREEKKFGR